MPIEITVDQQLRIEALRLALSNQPVSGTSDIVIESAKKYYEFFKAE